MGFFEETAGKLLADRDALRAEPALPETVSWQPTGQTFGEYWDALSETGWHDFVALGDPGCTPTTTPTIHNQGRIRTAWWCWRCIGGIRVNIELGDLKALRDMAGQAPDIRNDFLKATTMERSDLLS